MISKEKERKEKKKEKYFFLFRVYSAQILLINVSIIKVFYVISAKFREQ